MRECRIVRACNRKALKCPQEAKTEQNRASRAAKENRRSSANAPADADAEGAGSPKKAPSGVMAMRKFWENAGQKAEDKPLAGVSRILFLACSVHCCCS